MKAIVIYYSVNGGTRKIAHAIRKGMAELADEADIVAIKGANGVPGMKRGHLLEYDLIGIGSPVWRSIMTPNVQDFINNIPTQEMQFILNNNFEKEFTPQEKQHFFFFLVHGKSPGPAAERALKAMKARGLTVIGWDDWYGDAGMTYAQKPWQTEGHPDEISLQQAEEFGRQMVERSRRIKKGEINLIPEMSTGEEYIATYGPSFEPDKYAKWIGHHYGVKIDKEKCTKCGLCEAHCPSDAIDLAEENPILPTCMWCTVCEMVCPVGAVDINMAALKKDRGETLEEIYEKGKELQRIFVERQKLFKPEKRMRYHIDPKDLFTRGYVADLTGHPRIVIPEEGWAKRKKNT